MVATFFLSTGRCGTQWCADALDKNYSDRVFAVHEPVHAGYFANKLFNGEDINEPEYSELRDGHIARIDEIISKEYEEGNIHYIETGWPSYGAISYLLKRLQGRIRIVHISRHPITTASSMTTHNYYGEGRETMTISSLLSPFDKNSAFPELKDLWEDLSTFQKCLYFWTEFNNYALQLEKKTDAPWLRIKYEDLLGPENQQVEELLDFLDLPVRNSFFHSRRYNVDLYNYKSDDRWNVSSWRKIPGIADVADELGYEIDDFDEQAIESRYYSKDGEKAGKAKDSKH